MLKGLGVVIDEGIIQIAMLRRRVLRCVIARTAVCACRPLVVKFEVAVS